MATPAQIAANRQNAKKSSGPKTALGKQRSRDNARRHGLAVARPRETTPEMEELSLLFAQGCTDPFIIEHAREAADAELELAKLKMTRGAWIERAYVFGCTERPGQNPGDIERFVASPNWRELFDPSSTMPPPGPERLAEAIRRALPETAKLGRYEARAIARRDRQYAQLFVELSRNHEQAFWQNEPNFSQSIRRRPPRGNRSRQLDRCPRDGKRSRQLRRPMFSPTELLTSW
ncbi:hypothetical protein JQ597_13220 [Bradyrhizobium sp. AUGA SZCCT0177]|uniref:hypothetical protein n=1 Tax=Bradyrhizobium sp. AUGA SZCCT0177 TaxID=2807665 RepID=UPI001BA64229|nr:hypothetical protein [Bradyrhizobium sp. AUGA SZCCT0177]MBR1283000.1 hypothetical protein [Bradyrhizobium sp. AUGA SZCCT0177]